MWPRGPYMQGTGLDTSRTPGAPRGAGYKGVLPSISRGVKGYWYCRCCNNGCDRAIAARGFRSTARANAPALQLRPPDGRRQSGDHMSIAVRCSARSRRAIALLAVAALSACHRNRTASEIDAEANEPSTIEFKNESLAQADVFVAASSSGPRRIGTVFAGRTETLTIPHEIAVRGTVTVVARLLARSHTPSSGALAIGPGTHLSVRLPLDEKTLYVRPAT